MLPNDYFFQLLRIVLLGSCVCPYLFLGAQEPTEADFQSVFKSNLKDTAKISLVDSLAMASDYLSSELPYIYRKKAIELGISIGAFGHIALQEYSLGVDYCNIGEIDSSLYYLKQAENHYKIIGDSQGVADVYGLLRYDYTLKKDYPKALTYAYSALEIFEKIGDEYGEGASYVDISGVLLSMEKYEEALDYALKAVDILESYKDDPFELAYALEKTATVYSYNGDSINALSAINRTLDLFPENEGLSYNFLMLKAEILREFGENERAIRILESCRAYAIKASENVLLISCESMIGEIYLDEGKYAEALQIFQNLHKQIQSDNDAVEDDIEMINLNLYRTYEALNQFEPALQHYKAYSELKDSTFTIEADKAMSELRTQYETEKKEGQITQLKNEKSQQRVIIFLSVGFLILAAIFLLVLFRNNRERKKTNDTLRDQKEEIEKKSSQNELLLKEIHHRVKNNLQTISSLLFLQSAHIEDETVKEAVAEGQHRVQAMALIHQKLYQRENLAAIEMKDYLNNLSQALIKTFVHPADRIQLNLNMESIELDVDTAVPIGLIVNELITNSVKYAFPNEATGEISISLGLQSPEELVLVVSDNGKGMAEGEVPKGTAFGSQLTKQLTIQLDGKLEIDPSNGYLTRIVFRDFQVL